LSRRSRRGGHSILIREDVASLQFLSERLEGTGQAVAEGKKPTTEPLGNVAERERESEREEGDG
jgi:hypothetical protein